MNKQKKKQKKKHYFISQGFCWSMAACKPQIPLLLVVSTISALGAISNVWFALQTRNLINAAEAHSKSTFISACILMAALLIGQIILSSASGYLSSMCNYRNTISIRQRIFGRLLTKKYSDISEWHSGELLNRTVSDSSVVSDTVNSLLPDVVNSTVQLVFAMIILFRFDRRFTLILVSSGVILYGVGRFVARAVKNYHKSSQAADGAARSYMQEIMTSLLVIKVFNAFDRVKQKNKILHQKLYKIQMGRNAYSTLASTCFTVVAVASYAFALFWCGNELLMGAITFGELTMVQQLVARVRTPLSSLSGIFPRLANMEASAERLMEVENVADEDAAPLPNTFLDKNDCFERIEIKDLTFAYDFAQIDRSPVISHMDLTIEKGDFVAVTGTSGIGKSTIFKLLLGVYDQYYGELKLKMTSGTYFLGANTRKLFAYVPQGNFLFSGTILENITFIRPNATEEEIKKAIELSCASDFVDELEDGLETVVGERGAGLSEGQVQRLAIARAILSDAQVLLLDEATSALDENTEARVIQNLKTLPEQTCLIVTHRPCALAICNKRLEMKKVENG